MGFEVTVARVPNPPKASLGTLEQAAKSHALGAVRPASAQQTTSTKLSQSSFDLPGPIRRRPDPSTMTVSCTRLGVMKWQSSRTTL